jgi:hypothetical protein
MPHAEKVIGTSPLDAMIAALREAKATSAPEGFTVRDLVLESNAAQGTVQGWVRLAAMHGLVKCVGRRPAIRADGVGCKLPVYQLVKKAKR